MTPCVVAVAESPTLENETKAIPANPIATANIRLAVGIERTKMAVTNTVITGMPPLIIPVTDADVVSCALAYKKNGNAIHTKPINMTLGISARSIFTRAEGNHTRVQIPKNNCAAGTTAVSTWSRAIAANKD